MRFLAAQLKVTFPQFVLLFRRDSLYSCRREVPAPGGGAGAAQVGGDEACEAERDLRLLHREDVRGAGHHQLRVGGDELLLQQTLLLPELPGELPLLQHAAPPVHGELLLQPRLCWTLRQVGTTAANRVQIV